MFRMHTSERVQCCAIIVFNSVHKCTMYILEKYNEWGFRSKKVLGERYLPNVKFVDVAEQSGFC